MTHVTPRKAELEAIRDVLTAEGFDTPEQMARAVLKVTYQLLRERDWWVAGWQGARAFTDGRHGGDRTPEAVPVLFGPFATDGEALKAMQGGVARGPEGTPHAIFRVNGITPSENRIADLEAGESSLDPTCVCGHRKSNHDVPGARRPGCYAPRNVCECRHFTKRESNE